MKEYESEVEKRMKMIETSERDPLQDYKLSLMEMRVDRNGKTLKPRKPVLKAGSAETEIHELLDMKSKKHLEKMRYMMDQNESNVQGNLK